MTFLARSLPSVLLAVYSATPAALACSGMLAGKAATGASGFVLASFISLQTDAREMPCFFAT
jgi:hypothetical protein